MALSARGHQAPSPTERAQLEVRLTAKVLQALGPSLPTLAPSAVCKALFSAATNHLDLGLSPGDLQPAVRVLQTMALDGSLAAPNLLVHFSRGLWALPQLGTDATPALATWAACLGPPNTSNSTFDPNQHAIATTHMSNASSPGLTSDRAGPYRDALSALTPPKMAQLLSTVAPASLPSHFPSATIASAPGHVAHLLLTLQDVAAETVRREPEGAPRIIVAVAKGGYLRHGSLHGPLLDACRHALDSTPGIYQALSPRAAHALVLSMSRLGLRDLQALSQVQVRAQAWAAEEEVEASRNNGSSRGGGSGSSNNNRRGVMEAADAAALAAAFAAHGYYPGDALLQRAIAVQDHQNSYNQQKKGTGNTSSSTTNTTTTTRQLRAIADGAYAWAVFDKCPPLSFYRSSLDALPDIIAQLTPSTVARFAYSMAKLLPRVLGVRDDEDEGNTYSHPHPHQRPVTHTQTLTL